MMKRACVVIPLYKLEIDVLESISLKQCFRILHHYDIYFVIPKHLESRINSFEHNLEKQAKYKVFDDAFFTDIHAYNRLLKYPGFYKSFLAYEFMLIHQLDAFVFSDELNYWCNQGYDHIGAPLFEGYDEATKTSKLIGQGNGGFCLRKVKSCYDVVSQFKKLKFTRLFDDEHRPFYINAFRYVKHQIIYIYSGYPFQPIINEDLFWAEVIPENFRDFKVPNAKEAMRFSFEVNPDVLYALNNQQLPFGCHAWWRYDFEFWKLHINKFDFDI